MIRLLRERLASYRRQIVYVVLLALVQAIANLYLPTLNADLINNGVTKGDTAYILRVGGLMLAVSLISIVAAIVAVYFGSKVSMGLGRDVRGALFRRVESFSLVELNHFGTPSLITRTTNDVQQVQMMVLMLLNVILIAPITMIGGIIMAVRLNATLSLVIVVAIPVMVAFIAAMVRWALPLFRSLQGRIDRVNLVMREMLSGVRVIRAFDRTGHEEARFAAANAELTDTSLRVFRIFALMFPFVMIVLNVTTIAVWWFGARQVDAGDMPIGDLFAFLQYIFQILFSVLMASIMFAMVPRAAASAGRIQEVLETVPSIVGVSKPAEIAPRRGRVEFRDVEFRYPRAEEAVLSGISFTAEPGQTVAIVGGTGSGKSTLVNLIPRFYDVTSGSVLIDGVDVREYDLPELWSRIGLVPQTSFLFSGSVADNLRFGDEDATDDELWDMLGIAQGRDFVEEMPDGLATAVAQGGASVSGGQRQRLAIARALAKRAPVNIFDDSFSALDFTTDARLRAALKRELAQSTAIIVAQRVGTIMYADRIVVLEDGAIVAVGTHDELVATSETYREIVASQLTLDGKDVA